MATMIEARNFDNACAALKMRFKSAPVVHTESWQGTDISKRPEMRSYELLNMTMSVPLNGEELDTYRLDVQPNLPWADDHFEERVQGQPLNPGEEWANWPWNKSADGFRDEHGQFDHNYMERYWPKFAGFTDRGELTGTRYEAGARSIPRPATNRGIRGNVYGDMIDLVELLAREPLTRQAWIPIFFPEDTGSVRPGRKPCTLGYQFIVRDRRLHVYYPLRSCDFVRHFRDDIYLTIRLLLWVLEGCRGLNAAFHDVRPGSFTMHATSLHIFENDHQEMFRR